MGPALPQLVEFVPDPVRRTADVAGITPTRHQPQGDLLASAPDPQRRMRRLDRARSIDRPIQAVVATLERWLVFAPHVMDDLARFAKHGHALARRWGPPR